MQLAARRAIVRAMAMTLSAVLALAVLAPGSGRAGGESGSVRSEVHDGVISLEAEDASVADIIHDMARLMGFEVRGEPPGKDVRLTRSLEGTLDDLLAGLLRDGNYLLTTEAGIPKRLVILPAGAAVAPVLQASPAPAMSVDDLHSREGELVQEIAQYEDMRAEARERSKPELARKLDRYVRKLTAEAESIRARLPR
jgi:hypothetical protein